MLDCIDDETRMQDALLNNAYRQIGTVLAAERMRVLRAAQRLWIQDRDANCGFYADPQGGTLATVTANECVLRLTESRADELEQLIEMNR